MLFQRVFQSVQPMLSLNVKVLSRKSQLEELYVDNQELERKRREVEAWLSRMEGWRERMQPVSCDLLETQVREQKVC